MKIPIAKLKAMMRYFATFTDPKLLGKKKLMKLFYFTDFTHVKKYASPITFDNYVNMDHGPIPSTILNLVNSVENDTEDAILSDTISVEVKNSSLMKRIVSSGKFSDRDKGYFSPSELKVLDEVCNRFNNKTCKYIEDASHKEAAWAGTHELDNIPYTLAV